MPSELSGYTAKTPGFRPFEPAEAQKGPMTMGRLLYGDSGLVIEFDDRTLSHVHLVINAKLRRSEAFFFSWKDDPAVGNGRSSIWLESSIPLFFKFSTSERHTINREWLDALTTSANLPQGMYLTSEPGRTTPQPRSNV
ncbi:MAG: ATP-dependent ligase [Glaciihabitans sp.]|nr:ATP-dependent ligase [Glaciihabitans sp.]